MINYSITTLYYVGSNGIHFKMQEYNKAHSSKLKLSISACERNKAAALCSWSISTLQFSLGNTMVHFMKTFFFSPLYNNSSKLQQYY